MSDTHAAISTQRVIVTSRDVKFIVTRGSQGPRGARGPIGPAGGAALTRIAASPIQEYRIVASDGTGRVRHASANNPEDKGTVMGLSLGFADTDESVDVLRAGAIEDTEWAFIPGQKIWLMEDGLFSQTPPETGVLFSQAVGFCESPTVLMIDIQPFFVL
jgi:hypothetical protein